MHIIAHGLAMYPNTLPNPWLDVWMKPLPSPFPSTTTTGMFAGDSAMAGGADRPCSINRQTLPTTLLLNAARRTEDQVAEPAAKGASAMTGSVAGGKSVVLRMAEAVETVMVCAVVYYIDSDAQVPGIEGFGS